MLQALVLRRRLPAHRGGVAAADDRDGTPCGGLLSLLVLVHYSILLLKYKIISRNNNVIVNVYVYVYVYLSLSLSLSIYIYIHTYTHISA